jgi:hypothetical protein
MNDPLPKEEGTYEIIEDKLFMNLKGSPYHVASGSRQYLSELIQGSGFVSQQAKKRADRAKAKVQATTNTLWSFFFGPQQGKIKKKVKVVKGDEKIKHLFKSK